MTRIPRIACLLLLLAPAARAAEPAVRDAFSRATPGGGPGVAYMTIQGGDAADRLLSVTSPRAAKVELHSMVMAGSVMRMRELDGIDVPAGGTVVLGPGAPLHLMLEGLTAPLKAGDTLPLVLHFAKAGDKPVEAAVGSPGQSTPPAGTAARAR